MLTWVCGLTPTRPGYSFLSTPALGVTSKPSRDVAPALGASPVTKPETARSAPRAVAQARRLSRSLLTGTGESRASPSSRESRQHGDRVSVAGLAAVDLGVDVARGELGRQ